VQASRKLSYAGAVSAISVLFLSVLSSAQNTNRPNLSGVKIDNFGCINENYFRGAQPKRSDYKSLASLGVKSVVDLEDQGASYEPEMVKSAGMKFYRIGLSDKSWPSRQQAEQFLKIVNDPANQPVFVHCHGGRHRAGIMTAIYRITHDNWTADRAYAEMKQYGFDKGFGHGGLKGYVYDYYAGLNQSGGSVTSTTTNK
jgi:protein tyrosine/serine phosphatase